LTPPGPGSFTATFLRITVGVWMVPSSLGLNRWLLGPKACARWSRSPPLDRLPPLGAVMPSSSGTGFSDVVGDAPDEPCLSPRAEGSTDSSNCEKN